MYCTFVALTRLMASINDRINLLESTVFVPYHRNVKLSHELPINSLLNHDDSMYTFDIITHREEAASVWTMRIFKFLV